MTAAPGYTDPAALCMCPHPAGVHLITDRQRRGACAGTKVGGRVRCQCQKFKPRKPHGVGVVPYNGKHRG